MKNKINVLTVRVFGIIALVAVFTLSAASCYGQTLNSADALKTYLDNQPANSPDNPIKVSMGANDLMLPKIAAVLKDADKYVSLNLTGNTLTTIPDKAFKDCKTLVGIIIPNSVTEIGWSAFSGCESLASITVDSNNSNYSSQDGILYNKEKTQIILIPKKNIAIFNSGDALKEYLNKQPANSPNKPIKITMLIDDSMLENVARIIKSSEKYVSLNLIGDITEIPFSTFFGCTSLTSITIPNSVTSIGDGAFRDCTSLTSVTIPNSVTSISYYAFSGCTSLTAINVNNANTAYSSQDGILYNKNKTVLHTYPAGKTGNTFTIPNSVTSIGRSAFDKCTSLTSVTIPNSFTSIGRDAFRDCTSLTSVTIPNSVTSIESSAFYKCTSLTSVTIPNSVTSIESYAFYWTSLTSVTIPNSVTSIEGYAFYRCTSLTSVTFQGTITSDYFASNAFDGDLIVKYLAVGGGIGTYTTTTPAPNDPWDWKPVWTKR